MRILIQSFLFKINNFSILKKIAEMKQKIAENVEVAYFEEKSLN